MRAQIITHSTPLNYAVNSSGTTSGLDEILELYRCRAQTELKVSADQPKKKELVDGPRSRSQSATRQVLTSIVRHAIQPLRNDRRAEPAEEPGILHTYADYRQDHTCRPTNLKTPAAPSTAPS